MSVSRAIQVQCPKEYLGTAYGGWWYNPELINGDSIVYSFGAGEDVSFDIGLTEKHGCRVHCFDPTPKAVNYMRNSELPDRLRFYEFGVADHDGKAVFCAPANPNHASYRMRKKENTPGTGVEAEVRRVSSIMKMLGHDRIDLIKLDIEGCEYEVIEDVVRTDIGIGQILVEFHTRFFNGEEGAEKRAKAIDSLNGKGFRIFHVTSQDEYSFINIRET